MSIRRGTTPDRRRQRPGAARLQVGRGARLTRCRESRWSGLERPGRRGGTRKDAQGHLAPAAIETGVADLVRTVTIDSRAMDRLARFGLELRQNVPLPI